MPISNRSARSPIGTALGILLLIAGIVLLISTGAFAYFGLAGFVNSTYYVYVVEDVVGLILVVVGIIVAVFA